VALVTVGTDVVETTDATVFVTVGVTLLAGVSDKPAAPARPVPMRRMRRTPRTVRPASMTTRLRRR
jgi:hypothetical protein